MKKSDLLLLIGCSESLNSNKTLRNNMKEELREGYIYDFISEEVIKATPEEVDAVQVFSKRLVEDFGYKKTQIQTRPQFRVRRRPSDEDVEITRKINNLGKEARWTKAVKDLYEFILCKNWCLV